MKKKQRDDPLKQIKKQNLTEHVPSSLLTTAVKAVKMQRVM